MSARKRTAHVIAAADRGRITCDCCDAPATMTEHCPLYTGSVAFYQYCGNCWIAPAANGGPSAAERTGVGLPDVLDYERRWLAECRAHGETRRKLIAALHEAGDHSECDGDCTDNDTDAWSGGFAENH